MPRNARKTDLAKSVTPCRVTKCCPHSWTGVITEGSPSTTINGLPAARHLDKGRTNCPHNGTFYIMEPGSTVYLDGRQVARRGDYVQCLNCGSRGRITKASPNVSTDGGANWDKPMPAEDWS